MTRRKKTDAELRGLVSSLTPRADDSNLMWYQRPVFFGVIVLALVAVLNVIFW